MARRQGERRAARMSRGEKLWSQHLGKPHTCFHGGSMRRRVPVNLPSRRGGFLASTVLLLLIPTPIHIFFCFFATVGDFCIRAAATVEQSTQQRNPSSGKNTFESERRKETMLFERTINVLQAASLYDLRSSTGPKAGAAGGWTVLLATPTSEATLHAVASTSTADATAVAASGAPATAGAAKRPAESSSTALLTAGSEARRLGKPVQVDKSASSNRRYISEARHVAANTAADPKEGSARPQWAAVPTDRVLGSAQRKRQGAVLQERSADTNLRLRRNTNASAAKKPAATQKSPGDFKALQAKLDSILGANVRYTRLREQRDFGTLLERYADEEETPADDLTILKKARSDLAALRARKSTWITLMMSATAIFALSIFWWLVQAKFAPPRPLNWEEQQQRLLEWKITSMTALSALLLLAFSEWRRRELNQEIDYQELDTDRILFEAIAGLRPTTKNVLGPSKKEIKKFREAREKKRQQATAEKADMKERQRMRQWWEGA